MSGNVQPFNPYETASVAEYQVGHKKEDEHGDCYRYAYVGGSNITSGKLQVCPAPKTDHHNISVASAAAIGEEEVTVTLGGTAATVDEYAGGFIVFNDVAPEGTQYRITGHPAADASASLKVTLERPLIEALTTSTQVELNHNPWNGVVEAAVEERKPAGVPLLDVTANNYCWLKTKGIASVLFGDDANIGEELVSHASTAGAVDAANTTYGTAFSAYTIGKAKVAATNTELNSVELTID